MENAICSALDDLKVSLNNRYSQISSGYYGGLPDALNYGLLETYVWRFFLKRRESELKFQYGECQEVTTEIIQSSQYKWYEKLNLVEYVIGILEDYVNHADSGYYMIRDAFVGQLNADFANLFYGYRIIDGEIVPITDSTEIETIQKAIIERNDNVHVHLETALANLAKRPESDSRNSIKESISAVECLCREITNESTLDKAIPKLQAKGVVMNPRFEEGLKQLYFYTNDKRTGIRHALMDDAHTPTFAEAKFMLVICSAFVNYVRALI